MPAAEECHTVLITLIASSGKCNVMVWRPSVRLSVCPVGIYTHRDSPGGSIRRGPYIFRPDSKEDQHHYCCFTEVYRSMVSSRLQHLALCQIPHTVL